MDLLWRGVCAIFGHRDARIDDGGDTWEIHQCPRCLAVWHRERNPNTFADQLYSHFAPQLELLCAFDGHTEAVGVFYAPEGCICKTDTIQPLCAQHALKALGNGVDLRLICRLDRRDHDHGQHPGNPSGYRV
jgi:hypothetical protein